MADMTQTELTRKTDSGDQVMVVWLPVDPKVKQGSVISLKGEDGSRWTVSRQFLTLEAGDVNKVWRKGEIYHGWSNNI